MNITRRGFLTGIGAGLAAVKTGTGYRKLIPFVLPAEDITPGVATWYASGCRECPAGCGTLLRNREARIVKAEGNPLHSVNAGRLCARGQASLQGLYDPDRIPRPRHRVSGAWEDATWEAALAHLGRELASARRVGVISDLQSGSLADLIRRWLTALRSAPADYLVYEPFNYEPLRVANERVFGRAEIPDYRIERCDLLVSFGADFLETWLSPVELTRRFTEMRRVKGGKRGRFIYVGPRLSPTATQADWHILLPPGQEGVLAQAVAAELAQTAGLPHSPVTAEQRAELAASGVSDAQIRKLADAFRKARAPLALAGDPLPLGEEANASATAANLLNALAAANAAEFGAASPIDFGRVHALGTTATAAQTRAFLDRARAGAFDVLVVIGANPVYAMPGAKVAEALGKAKTVIFLNPFADDTVEDQTIARSAATWALPVNAPAESWGDYSPRTGVYALLQPAMGSTFQSRDCGDVLLQLAGAAGVSLPAAFRAETYYDFLRGRWRALQRAAGDAGDFEVFWHKRVQEGGLTLPAREVEPEVRQSLVAVEMPPAAAGGVRLHVYPSLHFHDGRNANRPWLQEIPDPMTRAVWGSWVELHPETARQAGIRTGDLVALGRGVELPAHVWEGVAPGTAAVGTGQGHKACGRWAKGRGVNAFALLGAGRVALRGLGRKGDHILSHGEQDQHGREIYQTVALSELAAHAPEPIDMPTPEGYKKARDVYPPHEHPEHRWALAVDLDRCNGCSACVAACYAENNIPAVGMDDPHQVGHKHDQPWLRIDRWDEVHAGVKHSYFQPMMCQQCDSAPCEPVCPVYAAVHGRDGLNEQVYNRCVGTRYCSNNCPYKARRFNWFHYEWPEPLNYQLNPDVTVRDRGVMEKCSFCVQRIREVTIAAKADGRVVQDGEITPACAQTCPADAFVFGDLNDPESRISKLAREDRRRYQVLRELNTKPAVFYQKRIVEEFEV